jgi:hypothetical protein
MKVKKTENSELEEVEIKKGWVRIKVHWIRYSLVPDIRENSRYIDWEEYKDKRFTS